MCDIAVEEFPTQQQRGANGANVHLYKVRWGLRRFVHNSAGYMYNMTTQMELWDCGNMQYGTERARARKEMTSSGTGHELSLMNYSRQLIAAHAIMLLRLKPMQSTNYRIIN